MVEELLKKGALPDGTRTGAPPIDWALDKGDVDSIKLLKEWDVNMDPVKMKPFPRLPSSRVRMLSQLLERPDEVPDIGNEKILSVSWKPRDQEASSCYAEAVAAAFLNAMQPNRIPQEEGADIQKSYFDKQALVVLYLRMKFGSYGQCALVVMQKLIDEFERVTNFDSKITLKTLLDGTSIPFGRNRPESDVQEFAEKVKQNMRHARSGIVGTKGHAMLLQSLTFFEAQPQLQRPFDLLVEARNSHGQNNPNPIVSVAGHSSSVFVELEPLLRKFSLLVCEDPLCDDRQRQTERQAERQAEVDRQLHIYMNYMMQDMLKTLEPVLRHGLLLRFSPHNHAAHQIYDQVAIVQDVRREIFESSLAAEFECEEEFLKRVQLFLDMRLKVRFGRDIANIKDWPQHWTFADDQEFVVLHPMYLRVIPQEVEKHGCQLLITYIDSGTEDEDENPGITRSWFSSGVISSGQWGSITVPNKMIKSMHMVEGFGSTDSLLEFRYGDFVVKSYPFAQSTLPPTPQLVARLPDANGEVIPFAARPVMYTSRPDNFFLRPDNMNAFFTTSDGTPVIEKCDDGHLRVTASGAASNRLKTDYGQWRVHFMENGEDEVRTDDVHCVPFLADQDTSGTRVDNRFGSLTNKIVLLQEEESFANTVFAFDKFEWRDQRPVDSACEFFMRQEWDFLSDRHKNDYLEKLSNHRFKQLVEDFRRYSNKMLSLDPSFYQRVELIQRFLSLQSGHDQGVDPRDQHTAALRQVVDFFSWKDPIVLKICNAFPESPDSPQWSTIDVETEVERIWSELHERQKQVLRKFRLALLPAAQREVWEQEPIENLRLQEFLVHFVFTNRFSFEPPEIGFSDLENLERETMVATQAVCDLNQEMWTYMEVHAPRFNDAQLAAINDPRVDKHDEVAQLQQSIDTFLQRRIYGKLCKGDYDKILKRLEATKRELMKKVFALIQTRHIFFEVRHDPNTDMIVEVTSAIYWLIKQLVIINSRMKTLFSDLQKGDSTGRGKTQDVLRRWSDYKAYLTKQKKTFEQQKTITISVHPGQLSGPRAEALDEDIKICKVQIEWIDSFTQTQSHASATIGQSPTGVPQTQTQPTIHSAGSTRATSSNSSSAQSRARGSVQPGFSAPRPQGSSSSSSSSSSRHSDPYWQQHHGAPHQQQHHNHHDYPPTYEDPRYQQQFGHGWQQQQQEHQQHSGYDYPQTYEDPRYHQRQFGHGGQQRAVYNSGGDVSTSNSYHHPPSNSQSHNQHREPFGAGRWGYGGQPQYQRQPPHSSGYHR